VVEGRVLRQTATTDEESQPLLGCDVAGVPVLDARVLVGRLQDRPRYCGERRPKLRVLGRGEVGPIFARVQYQQPL
jgi:hypothetical protein